MLMNVRNFALYNFFLEDKEYSTITDEEFKADVRRGVQLAKDSKSALSAATIGH
jgi:hypothetical protein